MKHYSYLLLSSLLLTSPLKGEEKKFGDRFRQKMIERWKRNQEEKAAPELSKLTTAKIVTRGLYTFSMFHGGLNRYYRIYVPASYDQNFSTPLLVALHGGGGSMNIQSEDKYYKIISKSEEAGYLVLFPNGTSQFKSGEFATWNAGKCCGHARDNNVDDVGFIRELIKKVSTQINVDSNKIFATGMSNGAMMSYRLACELTDVIKGIAAVAGTDNTINCTPSKPISIIHFHAKDDDHVLFNGGAGENALQEKQQITDYVSVSNSINKWVQFNKCSTTPKRVLEVKGAYCEHYSGCKNNVEVKLCVTETGGHSWPGGNKIRNVKGDNSKAISANDVMWDFFASK